MKQHQSFSVQKRIYSFKYAFNGLRILFSEEHNSRIHLLATICVSIAGFFFRISTTEWMVLVIVIGVVFSLELMNSSLENIADFISPEKHDSIKKVKDLAAAAVLVGAISAVIIGCIIFLPKLLSLC